MTTLDPHHAPKRRSNGTLLAALGVAIVLLIAGNAWLASLAVEKYRRSSNDRPAADRPTAAAPPVDPPPAAGPPLPGGGPGIEPPQHQPWPATWAKFQPGEATTQQRLDGLGFDVTLPTGWRCAKGTGAEVRWTCIDPTRQAGGDLVVRRAASWYDARTKISLRKAEGAWGRPWIRPVENGEPDGHTSFAETTQVAGPDGTPRYGLVLVRYWHSRPGGPLDRQLVFRMTAPIEQADEIRKIANSVREATT
jgi:hypothetical protein